MASGEQLHPGWSQGRLLLQEYLKWVVENQKATDMELSQCSHPHLSLLLKGFPAGVCWPGHWHSHLRTLFALKEKEADGQCLCLPTPPQ